MGAKRPLRLVLNIYCTGIYECNQKCKCAKTCLNRVAQHPLRNKLQVSSQVYNVWFISNVTKHLSLKVTMCSLNDQVLIKSIVHTTVVQSHVTCLYRQKSFKGDSECVWKMIWKINKKLKLQVFKTQSRGWGVRTLVDMPQGNQII